MTGCPTRCGRSVPHGHFMCPACLLHVPEALQDAVTDLTDFRNGHDLKDPATAQKVSERQAAAIASVSWRVEAQDSSPRSSSGYSRRPAPIEQPTRQPRYPVNDPDGLGWAEDRLIATAVGER